MFDTSDDSYSNIPKLRVSLRIRGEGLDPDLITQYLGVAPTFAARRGDVTQRSGGEDVRSEGIWVYRLSAPAETELGELVEMLLGALPSDSNLWEELTATYTADVLCGVFLEGDNQSTLLSVEALTRLGKIGLPLSLDLHAPFGDSGQDV